MRPDRFRVFTKRGAAIGVLAVVGAMAAVVIAGIVIAALSTLVF